VPLATLTDDDLLEEGGTATAVQSLRDRMNGVRPQYISPTHNWEQITADEIIGSTYRTEDGQPLTQTWALNLVKSAAQAGELASYALVDSREIGPIELNAKAAWRFYRPGEAITVNSELLGYNGPAVIVQRDFDPQTLAVRLTLKSETPAKHSFALGKVANPPPTPVIGQTQEERDGVAGGAIIGRGAFRIRTYVPAFPVTPASTSVAIAAFTGTIEDGRTISFPADAISSLTASTFYSLFWDLVTEDYLVVAAPGVTEQEDSRYVFVGAFATEDGSGGFPSDPTPPDGWNPDPNYQEP
jgi:hypothetical protein